MQDWLAFERPNRGFIYTDVAELGNQQNLFKLLDIPWSRYVIDSATTDINLL
jgi:hypothetical protein